MAPLALLSYLVGEGQLIKSKTIKGPVIWRNINQNLSGR
jgi:hypothetical protein